MEEEPATIRFANADNQQQSGTALSPSVKFSPAKIASLVKSPQHKPRHGGFERCAVSFASAAIRLNDLLSAEAEEANNSSSYKDSEDNLSVSSVQTVASEPSQTETTLNRSMDMDDGDNDSIVSSPCEGGSGVRRLVGERLTRRWKSGDNHLSAGSTPNTLSASHSAMASDRESIESNASSTKSDRSKLAVMFDKARSKGRKLVSSNKRRSCEHVEEACQALILTSEEVPQSETPQEETKTVRKRSVTMPSIKTNCNTEAPSFLNWVSWEGMRGFDEDTMDTDEKQRFIFHALAMKCRNLPLVRQRLTLVVVLVGLTFILPGFITGFLWGLYLSFIGFLYLFVSEPVVDTPPQAILTNDVLSSISEELQQRNTTRNVVLKGWMNELRGIYDPAAYHVNSSQSVLVRLDGNMLRISRPSRSVLKHAFHTDPTLSEPEPTICGHSIYDLTDAVVSLRPKRLAVRRWWSRKYPIHIRLANAESEVASIDNSAMMRSQSAHQSVSSTHKQSTDMTRSDSADSNKSKTASIENSVSDYREEGYYPDDSSENDDEAQPLSFKSGRTISADDVSVLYASGSDRDPAKLNPFKPRGRSLYLFVRSAREKERWFHRLREACSQYRKQPSNRDTTANRSREPSPSNRKSWNCEREDQDLPSVASSGSLPTPQMFQSGFRRTSLPSVRQRSVMQAISLEYLQYVSTHVQFQKHMSDVFPASSSSTEDKSTILMDLGRNKWKPGTPNTDTALVLSANAIGARIFYDFCRDAYWVRQVQEKIQSKLATIHLPYFIETLALSSLDLGTVTPQIVSVYPPILDDWGLWIDFELKYHGGIHLVLETRVNLMKLKSGQQRVEAQRKISRMTNVVQAHHYSDEELPESPESSPDEDFGSKTEKSSTRERTGKKLLSMVDKIANSKYFQGASELKPVKKMMEEISSTRLMLNVEVTFVEGPMTINVPPPPSDRLWYAFRKPPKISIRSVPQVGDRSVDMSTVSDWIENKLRLLLEKNLVCPNMDDVLVPVMSGNELLKGGYNK